MENLTSIENLSVNLRNFRVVPFNKSDLTLSFGPDDTHEPFNFTFLSLLQLNDFDPGQYHQFDVEGAAESRLERTDVAQSSLDEAESRLERTDVAQSTLDEAMLVALHAITAWGPKALASSTLTAVGSVLVSLLVGLVLWLGIFQYLGVPRRTNRSKSFMDQREMLNAIAEKVVRDLAEYRTRMEVKEDIRDLLETPSEDRRHVIPFPMDVDDPDVGTGSSDPSQHTLKITLVDDGGSGKIYVNHLDQFRHRAHKQSSLKPFRPSPVDDVILTLTTVPPRYSAMAKMPNLRNHPHRRADSQQLRRHGSRRIGKPRPNKPDMGRAHQARPHALKRSESREIGFPRGTLDSTRLAQRRTEGEQHIVKPNKDRDNMLSYRQEDPPENSGDHQGGISLPDRTWGSLNGRSVKKELVGDDYSALSDQESDQDQTSDVSTEMPISVTTFRTNRKHNFMDRLGSDPYEIAQYFPNNFQPVNLYHDHTKIESLRHKAVTVEPLVREEMIQRIKNLYDTFIGNEDSLTPISEYLDPTSYVANRNFFEVDFQRDLQELSHHLPPNTSVHNAIESFNHRHAIVDSGEDERRRNESSWKEGQVASSVEHIVSSNLHNHHHHMTEKKDGYRSAEVDIDLPSLPIYNATSKQKVFEKVKGISDELLMALFPDYMMKQTKANKRNHKYDGYKD